MNELIVDYRNLDAIQSKPYVIERFRNFKSLIVHIDDDLIIRSAC